MSQFQTFPAPDPLSQFSPFGGSSGGSLGPTFRKAGQAANRGSRQDLPQRTWTPFNPTGGPSFTGPRPSVAQASGGRWRPFNPSGGQGGSGFGRRQGSQGAWNSLFSGAVFGDMQRQQDIMDQQFGRLNQVAGQFGQAVGQGAEAIRGQDERARQTLEGQAQGAEQLGRQGFDEFVRFRDQQIGAVGQDIARANEQAAGAVAGYERTMGEYQDRTALQAKDLAVGLSRQVQSAMAQLNGGVNPDGTMMTPAEQAAIRTTMQRDVAEQTSTGINQIYTQFNDTMASMGQNLAALRQAQSQTTMAGGQLRGQVGTAFGAQTVDAQRQRAAMTELSSNLRVTMEQMSAASELGAVNLLVGGYKEMYDMIQGNRRGTTSMYAALSGWLAGVTTPGLGQIAPPDFRNL
jgi:hypothetical protein